jgi:putative transposase
LDPTTDPCAQTLIERFHIVSRESPIVLAADCLTKDRDALLAFYDFPADHWKHLRTTNPIESTFATVRHRTIRSKGCLSNKTALAMVFKLVDGAQKSWRRIDGHNQLPKLIQGVKFADGIEFTGNSAVPQAQAAA